MRADRGRVREASAAYLRVLETTGDVGRAERVRAQILGEKPPVASLTRKAATAGRLPATTLADQGVRSNLQAAGVRPRIPEGGLVGQFGKDIARAAVDAPAGYWQAAKVARNMMLPGGDREQGHRDLRAMGRGVRDDVRETLRHPLRHPGNTFLDLAMIATEGAGAALAAPRALSKVRKVPGNVREISATVRNPRPYVRGVKANLLEDFYPDPVQREWKRRLKSAGKARTKGLPIEERRRIAEADMKSTLKMQGKLIKKQLDYAHKNPAARAVIAPIRRPLTHALQPRGLERDVKLAASLLTTDATLRRIAAERYNRRAKAEGIVTHR